MGPRPPPSPGAVCSGLSLAEPGRGVGSGLLQLWRPLEMPGLAQRGGLGQWGLGVGRGCAGIPGPHSGAVGAGAATPPQVEGLRWCHLGPGRTGARGLVGVPGWPPAFAAKRPQVVPIPRPHSGPYSSGLLPSPDHAPCLTARPPRNLPLPTGGGRGRRWSLWGAQGEGRRRPGAATRRPPWRPRGSLTGRSRSADAARPPLPGAPRPGWSQGRRTRWALPRGARGAGRRKRAPATARR